MTINKTIRGIRDQIPAGYVIGRTSGKGAAQLIKIKDMVRANQKGAHVPTPDIQALLDSIGSTQGDILYRNATDWVVLAPGTAGNFLTTNGASANPSWTAQTVANIQTLLDGISSTQGTILYRNASSWVALSPGTAGSVLETQGAAANPQWASLSALLDLAFSSTRGVILYRGNSAWAALATGTAGFVLGTGGAGADPSWGDNHITINGHSTALGGSVTITGSDITNINNGYTASAFHPQFPHGVSQGNSQNLVVSGGSIAFPIYVPTPMKVVSVTIRVPASATNGNTGEFNLYVDDNTSNTLNAVSGFLTTIPSFTTSAQNLTLTLSSPVNVAPGIYWMVIRNTGSGTNAWSVSGVGQASGLAYNASQTKTLGSALGSTLDFVAATWTKQTLVPAVVLNGKVFNQSTIF